MVEFALSLSKVPTSRLVAQNVSFCALIANEILFTKKR